MTAAGMVPASIVRAYAVEIHKLHALLDRLGVPHLDGEITSARLERFVKSYTAMRSALKKADT
jgi:hypothetical protein